MAYTQGIFHAKHLPPKRTVPIPNKIGNVHITLRHIRKTTVVMEKQEVLHILSMCLQPWPACNAH